MKGHASIKAVIYRLLLDGLELGAGQWLGRFEVAVEKQVVAWDRDPIDVLEPAANADADAMFGVVESCRRHSAAAQLRKGRVFLPARPLQIHDRMPGDTAFAGQLGAKLDPGAQLNVIGEQPLISRVGSLLDDDVARLQQQPGDKVVNATAVDQGSKHRGGACAE